jgi:ATP-dependent DNA helicase DinG
LDEAHQFLSAARSIYGTELSVTTIPEIAKKIIALNYRSLDIKQNQWREVRNASYTLAKQLILLNKQLFFGYETDSICDDSLRKIRATADYLRKVLKGSHRFLVERDQQLKYKLLPKLEGLSNKANALSENAEQLRWFERDKENDANLTLHGLPKQLNNRLYEDLWKRGVPSFLTSGTLSAAGDFSAFKRKVGMLKINPHQLMEITHPSPYNYRKNCLLYLSRKVPYPKQSSKTYIDALTDEIERLIIAAHGHTAILFTSYNVMGRVFSKLQKRKLPFPLFKLERSTSNAIEQFKQSSNGVLFASGALWEGIDIPGDTLSMLIIAKLPFASPSRISEYEQTQYPSFYEYLNNVITPEMLVKLKQGFGRLIRTVNDTGVVAILDIRAHFSGAYHERVINSLPNCHITESINEIEGFIQTVKPHEYFK